MTKIITSENRIIFDGHSRTKEECETISLACEELAKSDKFRTVKYGSGYAEFEKVGVARELKFAPAYGQMIIYNATGAVVYKQMIYFGDSSMDVSLQGNKIIFTKNSTYIPTISPYEDATVNTANISVAADVDKENYQNATRFEITLPYAPVKIRYFGGFDGQFAEDYYSEDYSDAIINSGETITLQQGDNYGSGGGAAIQYYEEVAPIISFKHRFKNDTLIGTGTYKFRRYSVEEPTPTPSGETWLLNDDLTGTNAIDVTVNFVSNNLSYTRLEFYTTMTIRSLIYYGASTDTVFHFDFELGGVPEWTNDAYRTITFSTAPTGALLTWLQGNATKQS